MFEYYLDLYKKNIFIITISILILIIGWFWYYYFNNYKIIDVKEMWNNKVNIKIDKTKNEIKLVNNIKDNTKKDTNKYNYQVKVFLNKYDISCNWKKEICDKIIKNKEKLDNYILWNYSWELKKIDDFKLNIDNFFSKSFDENVFKANTIDLLYTFQNNFIKESDIKNTWFEKYFKYKLEAWEKNIVLNNMEVQCASEIKMSIIPWTFEEDEIISKKVEENCKNLWWENFLTLEIKKENKLENNKINLELKIKNLKIEYIFLEKKDLKFEQIDSKEVLIDYEKNLILKKDIEKNTKIKKEKVVEKKENKKIIIENINKNENNNKQQNFKKRMNDILKEKYRKKINNILLEKYRKK